MAASLTLHRETLANETSGYKVIDRKDNVVGFLAKKNRQWGFVFVAEQLAKKPNIYHYKNKKTALEALVFARFSKTETGSIKIIK
jgi:hypothetical protein